MTLTNLLTEQAAAILAHKIVSSDQVKTIEPKAAHATGCSMFELMQRAGEAAFKVLLQKWPNTQSILVVAGNGNNAGDGYVLAKLAKQQDLNVIVTCEQPERELIGDAKLAQSQWHQVGGKTVAFSVPDYSQFDVLVDALLGTGVSGEVKPTFKGVIQQINQANALVLSIDIPSGMNANTGQAMPTAVNADVTVTFVATKPGLVSGIGKEYCGKLLFADLQVGIEFFSLAKSAAQVVNWSMLQPLLPRPVNGNKGSFGKLLCIGGNQGMAGAIRLSAESALRCGVGLVKVFCHESSSLSISSGRPEIMLAHKDLDDALNWCSCVILGPGLGQNDWAHQQFSRILAYLKLNPKPLVLDADGLNLLAMQQNNEEVINTLARLPALVSTPHPGEASRLLACDIASIENDRYLASKSIAQKFNSIT